MMQTNGKISYAFGLEEFNIAKITTVPKAIYRFNVVCVKLLMTFFTGPEKS